jgi:methanogenic corrinoid protein MtbC1
MSDPRDHLFNLLADLDEAAVLDLVRARLAAGHDPLAIIEDCHEGIRLVGKRYEAGEYFISGLIMSGEIFREVVELVQPALENRPIGQPAGKILLGTVAGDIHDIGKQIAGMLLACYGFNVVDLGTDVPDVEFAKKAVETQPDIVGLSGLITGSFESMKSTIAALRAVARIYNLKFPIIIGGGIVDEAVCRYVGADYWVTDVMSGVDRCQKIMQAKPGQA